MFEPIKKTLIGACVALSLAGLPALAQQAGTIGDVDGASVAQSARADLQAFLTRNITPQQLQSELSAAVLADPALASLLVIANANEDTTRIIGASLARAAVLSVQNGNTDGAVQILSAISNAPQGQIQTTFSTFEPQSYGVVTVEEGNAPVAPTPVEPTPLSPFL